MNFLLGTPLGPGRLEWTAPDSVVALAIAGAVIAWLLAWWTGRDARGNRVCSNVFIAGATLAGSEPWREGSGAGVSLATGHRAAGLVLEEAA